MNYAPAPAIGKARSIINHAIRVGICTLAGVLFFHSGALQAQSTIAPTLSETAMQALYLYNFSKFVEWPEKSFPNPQSPINLCIYGEKPADIRVAVGAIDGKLTQSRTLKIKHSVTLADLGVCQIVFIPTSEKRWLPDALRVAHANSALTVSDIDDFVDAGGGIGLIMVDQKIRFDCNLDITQAAGLKLSAQLLKLARTVKGQGAKN